MSRQRGQANAEYIVVVAAIVLALFQPIPSNLCPVGKSECNVLQMLMQVLKNRYEGFSFAISASEYPSTLIDLPPLPEEEGEDLDGSSSDNGSVYTPPSSMTAVDADGNTIGNIVNGIVLDEKGQQIGTVNEKGEVVDANGNVIGTVSAGTSNQQKVAVDSNGNIIGKVDANGYVIDADTNEIIGKVDARIDPAHKNVVYGTDNIGLIEVSNGLNLVTGVISADGTVPAQVIGSGALNNGKLLGSVTSITGDEICCELDGDPIGTVDILGRVGTVVGNDVIDAQGNVIGSQPDTEN